MIPVSLLPELFAANRLLPVDILDKLTQPSSYFLALGIGLLVSLVAVFAVMIWRHLKLEAGQFLLFTAVGGLVLAPAVYFLMNLMFGGPAPESGAPATGIGAQSQAVVQTYAIPGVIYIPIILFLLSLVAGSLLAGWLRLKDMGWKFGLILGAWLASISIILLGEFRLGVDLNGGVILVYEVNEEATNRLLPPGEKFDSSQIPGVLEVLKRRLNPDGLKELVIRQFGPKQIEFVIPETDEAEVKKIEDKIKTGGALQFLIVADPTERTHSTLVDRATKQAASRDDKVRMDDKVMDGDKVLGYWKKAAVREREQGATLSDETGNIKAFHDEHCYGYILRNPATGSLIQVDREAQNEKDFPNWLANRGIKDVEVLLHYDPKNDIKGEDLGYARKGFDKNLRLAIDFSTKGQGVSKMGSLTSNNLHKKLAILFDNELLSAPEIQSQINDSGQITGNYTKEAVDFMVEILKSGSMPVVLSEEPISKNTIGSILGLDTVRKGSISIAVSLLVVLVFTAVYYRFAGLVACLALILNILLTVGIMVMLAAPFTLPGLAGIVLTVGMSVDSNVLIFERIREELAKGSALRMALRNGFDRAMTTIIDSNLTTLLTAVVLYAIGTDQVRGFGITLILGILTSMFTAIFCARTIFEAGERVRWLKSLTMMRLLTKLDVDWCKLFPIATTASVILITIGLVATVARGMGILDIDFRGGSTATFILREPKSDADVRKALAAKFSTIKSDEVKGSVDFSVYEISVQAEQKQTVYKVDSNLPDVELLKKTIQEAFKTDGKEGLRTYKVEVATPKTVELSGAPATRPAAPGAGTPSAEPPLAPEKSAPESPAKTPEEKAKTPETPAEPEKSEAKPAPEETKKTGEEPAADKPAEPKLAAVCGSQEEPKDDAKKDPPATEKKEEAPKAEPAAESKPKAEETEAAKENKEAKETKEEEKPATTPPATATPAAETEPAPFSSDAPTISQFETTVDLKFPGGQIGGEALKGRIEAAIGQALQQKRTVSITRKDPVTGKIWNGKDPTPYEDWTVILPLGAEESQKVLSLVKSSMETSPVWQSSNKMEGQVTVDTQLKALTAILVSLLGIVMYIWFRFQSLSWGIAAVVALVHDTLVMLGFIAMSYWLAFVLGWMQVEEFKISLTIVAAFLTLIGYSINDTIVIFDRIREIRGKSPDLTRAMINDSVNQTMSRTILTTGTVLMVVVVLYFAGGSGIHAFAYSMIIGALAGTYSTVFIAAPLLLWLHNRPSTAGGKLAKPALAEKPAASARGA